VTAAALSVELGVSAFQERAHAWFTQPHKNVRAWLLRAELVRRDNLPGDRIEAERLAAKVFPAAPSYVVPAEAYRETRKGGAFKPRRVRVGEQIGDSRVVAFVGISKGGRTFEVTCAGCGKIQLRRASEINRNLRLHRSIECPRCANQRKVASPLFRMEAVCDRVMDGGPVYTRGEEEYLCDRTMDDLVREFGPAIAGDDAFPLSALSIAAGWREDLPRWRVTEEGERGLEEERPTAESLAAAKLLQAIAEGEQEDLDETLRENAELDAKRARRRGPPVWRIPVAPYEPLPNGIVRVIRCRICGQRFPCDAAEGACSPKCQKRMPVVPKFRVLTAKEAAKEKAEAVAVEEALRRAEVQAWWAKRSERVAQKAAQKVAEMPAYKARSDLSIFEIYAANNNRADFWVWRPSFRDKVVRVIGVGFQVGGELNDEELTMPVKVEAYDRATGRRVRVGPMKDPGVRAHVWLDPPPWWR
jgi:hypothetical protein